MRRLPEFSVKNSLLVNLFSFFIIIVGLISMFQLRRDVFPPVDLNVVNITTSYPNAPAEDVEKLVTIPIEKELRGLSGIKKMASTSEEGISKIGIEIEPSEPHPKDVISDIKDAVDRVHDLPAEVEEDPLVRQIKTRERPVIEISLSGNLPESLKRKYAEELEDRLLDVSGVATVQRIGWRDREIWVEVDPKKLEEYHVSMEEIRQALRTRNVTQPAGRIRTPDEEYTVRTTAEFQTPEEVENVIIRANDAGNWLRVKDVGRAVAAFEDETLIAKTNGKRSLPMVVIKSEKADVIHVVSRVNRVLDNFRRILPKGMDVTITNDYSYYVQRRLNVLKNNGLIGFILVIVILFLFLDPVPAVATALGLPIAFFSTFIMMRVFDLSINLVTMLGLIIVLGMLVDDGIIVAENVYRYLEKGVASRQAAVMGTSEVIMPVTVTILTTFAAFAPLMFMNNIIGKFVRYIPLVVMIALASSLMEAFIILPSHLADFVKAEFHNHQSRKKSLSKIDEKLWYKRLKDFYLHVLKRALDHRYGVVLGVFLGFLLCLFIAIFWMKIILFTGEGMEFFYVRAIAKENTSLEKTNQLLIPVENLIASLPKSELDAYRTYVSSIEEEGGWDPNAKHGPHYAQITVFLTPSQTRKRCPKEIVDSLRPKLKKIKGFKKLYFYLPKEGPSVGHPVEVDVKGENFSILKKVALQIAVFLQKIPGVSDVDAGINFGKKQLMVHVDEEKAKQYYLTVGQIASEVRNAFRGGVATTVKPKKADKEIDVLVRFPKKDRNNMDAFEEILIPNKFDNLIPLKAVATIEEEEGFFAIKHLGGKRVISVTANVDNAKATAVDVIRRVKKKFGIANLEDKGYTLKFGGEYEEQMKTQKNLLTSFLIAFFLIFIILTAMLGSLMQPLIVMMAIPFGFMGVVIGFLLHGRPLSFFALMGVVGLAGIVVNNSIVLIDFVNRLRQSGKGRRDSLIEAGEVRLRPVLMTTITTIAGLVSVAYGIGGGDPFLKPMGLAIIWGLFFSTGLTLIVIPCLYAIMDDISKKIPCCSTPINIG